MIVLRSAVFQASFYLWTLIAGIVFVPLLAMPRRVFVPAGRLWCRGVLWLLRVTVGLTHRVEGRENVPDGPVIYAFKHQSAWDTVAVCLLVEDPAIVVKKELMPIPIFGWYLWKHGMIPIDRKAGSAALRKLVADAGRAVADGRPPVVFPEGTRTAPGDKRPYHPGVAALYTRLDLPVVPVALDSGLFWRRRAFVKRPGNIRVRFLPAIPTGLARRDFMARLQSDIEAATDALVRDAGGVVDRTGAAPVNAVEN